MPVQKVAHKAGVAEAEDLVVVSAMCCSIQSLYCKCPDCCGCFSKFTRLYIYPVNVDFLTSSLSKFLASSVCCCCKADTICCKPSNIAGECCIFYSGGQYCIEMTTCCKGITQCCCCDNRYAFPCDKDVPCVFAICFCVLCVNWEIKCCACCHKLGAYVQVKNPDEGVGMPRFPLQAQAQVIGVQAAYAAQSAYNSPHGAKIIQMASPMHNYPNPLGRSSYEGRPSFDDQRGSGSGSGRSAHGGSGRRH